MSSAKHASRIGAVAFSLGVGTLVATGAGAGIASATPNDSTHSSSSSSSSPSSASPTAGTHPDSSAGPARPPASGTPAPVPQRAASSSALQLTLGLSGSQPTVGPSGKAHDTAAPSGSSPSQALASTVLPGTHGSQRRVDNTAAVAVQQPGPHTETASDTPGISPSQRGILDNLGAPSPRISALATSALTPRSASAAAASQTSTAVHAAVPALTAEPVGLVPRLVSVGPALATDVSNSPAAPSLPASVLMGALDLIRRETDPSVSGARTLADIDNPAVSAAEREFRPWEAKGKFYLESIGDTCSLAAVASVIHELTGKPTTQAAVQKVAEQLQSVYDTDERMSTPGNPNLHAVDAVALLKHLKFTASLSTSENPVQALDALQNALATNKAVLATLDAQTIWRSLGITEKEPDEKEPPEFIIDHMVVVTGVDLKNGIVYINDPGPEGTDENGKPRGQNLAVPLGVFLASWSVSDYTRVVAGNGPTATAPASAGASAAA